MKVPVISRRGRLARLAAVVPAFLGAARLWGPPSWID